MWKINKIALMSMFLPLLAFMACSEEQLADYGGNGDGNLTLSFTCSQPPSRAVTEEEGEDIFNENKISKLDCYFYPSESKGNTAAVHHLKFDHLKSDQGKVDVRAQLSETVLGSLFANGATACKIYVIANVSDEMLAAATETSVNVLKQLEVSSKFSPLPHSNEPVSPQNDFVMDSKGDDLVKYDRDTGKLTGTVSLFRAASKITLTIDKVNSENGDDMAYVPQLEYMRVALYRGVSNSYLDSDKYPEGLQQQLFDLSGDHTVEYHAVTREVGGVSTTVYEQEIPFYSYAKDWNDAKDDETYLILMLPWRRKDDINDIRNYYYRIPVNQELRQLKRNMYYKINLTISALGSLERQVPAKMQPSCQILDWNKMDITSVLKDYNYLVVSPNRYVLHHQDAVEIPFASSRKVKILNYKEVVTDFSKDIPEEVEVKNGSAVLALDHKKKVIRYQQTLSNDCHATDFILSPRKVTFTVCHEDDPNFKENLEIVHYPPIYAEYEVNSDYSAENPNAHHGYVFVNGYKDEDSYQNNGYGVFGKVEGMSSVYQQSPSQYVFTVSSVQGTDYVIGDPREKEPTQWDNSAMPGKGWWTPAPGMENSGQSRILENYYATDTSPATEKVVAPKFRLASSYSYVDTGESSQETRYLEVMKKRCASYQEDGYPAGRWRLPTLAEFQFILTLVNHGKLPGLYALNEPYWCAHGLGTPKDKEGRWWVDLDRDASDAGVGRFVRCVYDEWYWGSQDKCDKTKFTWGDRPRKK